MTQLQALRDTLPALSNVLVFAHHPLHAIDVSENRWFKHRPAEARSRTTILCERI